MAKDQKKKKKSRRPLNIANTDEKQSDRAQKGVNDKSKKNAMNSKDPTAEYNTDIVNNIMETIHKNHEAQTSRLNEIMEKTETMNNATHDCVNSSLNDIAAAFVNIKKTLIKDIGGQGQLIPVLDVLWELKQKIDNTTKNIAQMENLFDTGDLCATDETAQQILQKMKMDMIYSKEDISKYANSIK